VKSRPNLEIFQVLSDSPGVGKGPISLLFPESSCKFKLCCRY